jgi:hypothetical protein
MNTAPPALIHNIKIILFVKRVFLQNRTFKVQQLKRKKCGILLCLHNKGQVWKTGRGISEG